MNTILETANKSKENFVKSGDDKKRTIIILDEANSLVNSDAFNKFIENCSTEYKCTLFLTANYPKRIKPETLRLISRIESIDPPDRDNIKAVINHILKLMNKTIAEHLDPVLDRLAPSSKGLYSNTDISMIVKNATSGKNSATASDIKNYIDNEDFRPSITPKYIDVFNEQKKYISEILKGKKL
jgi:DNA polymerase III delta prime subunit